MNITKEQNAATGDLVELIASRLGQQNRAIHAETAISAAAHLTGSLLLRSFKLDMNISEPGSVVLSVEANTKGPELINILTTYLSASEVQIDRTKIGGQASQKGEAPQLSILDALTVLQDDAIAICKRHSLDLESSAQAAALATAFVVKESAAQIGAETGINIAIYGFIEGTKTMPPLLAVETASTGKKNPWYKFW